MRATTAVLAMLAGCGFEGQLPDSQASDPVASPCWDVWQTGPRFDPPVRLDALDSGDPESDPYLTADELEIWFTSDRADSTKLDLWHAARPDRDASFGPTVEVDTLASPNDDSRLVLVDDGLTAVFARASGGPRANVDLYRAARADLWSLAFAKPTRTGFENVNTPGDESDPSAPSDRVLYFTRDAGMFRAERPDASSPYAAPVRLAITADGDADPHVDAIERVLAFARPVDNNGHELFYALADGAGGFTNPTPIPDVGSPAEERDPFVSADGCRLYFASDATGSANDSLALWYAQLQVP